MTVMIRNSNEVIKSLLWVQINKGLICFSSTLRKPAVLSF